MKLGIMQPYFFPYLGYFQLISHCDTFVLLDDVQYMKGGWINRNRILFNGQPRWLTYPVTTASTFAKIVDREYVPKSSAFPGLVNKLSHSYGNARGYEKAFALLQSIFEIDDVNVASFNAHLLELTCNHLEIDTNLLRSSKMGFDKSKKGQERVIEICKALGANEYVNPISGAALYDSSAFDSCGIELNFLKMDEVQYDQGLESFVPSLSIIDLLMFNGQSGTIQFLESYTIV